MNFQEKLTINKKAIRHQFDMNRGEFYFSIIDTIQALDLSTDPRNYWKVLKNRLKKGNNKLVTECNQLKMPSCDGKFYLTDVATHGTLLQIIELIAPEKVTTFGEFFTNIERKNDNNLDKVYNQEEKLSTASYEEGEIQVDLYQEENYLFVKAMLAGVNPEDIFISLNSKVLTLRINRIKTNNLQKEMYDHQELIYGKFSRIIELPYEVDIDRVEANSSYGLLSIKLSILDKTRTKIIKVK